LARFQIIEGGRAPDRDLAAEARDTEQTIRLWHQKASDGRPPHPSVLDFHRLNTDWGYRFVISSDEFLDAAVFVVYGLRFARLLSLPDKPNPFVPMLPQLPARYRDLFIEGCSGILVRPEPARFTGAVRHESDVELYRAAFMPLDAGDPSRPLIYGTFNRRSVPLSALRGSSKSEHLLALRVLGEQPRRN
jgi:hypothetical protein